ncbi:MAG TPA: DUF488 domain-containing protein [Rhizomicrobium sp.]|jgi:uncharacterized protein (DUF488 family)
MPKPISVATIGFTKKSAEEFFRRLETAKVKKVIDVRLHNTSQLAGFAKADDLAFFLDEIGGITYEHAPLLAPTDDIIALARKKGDWVAFETQFRSLMATRKIERELSPAQLDGACLLCAEDKPHHCHRRIVCDYLNDKWHGLLKVTHL